MKNTKNNNVVAMILDQAKTGREIVGAVVTLVPDNKQYKLTAYDAVEGTITVTEILDEDSEAVAEVVTLSDKNAHIGHYVCNPNEKPVPTVTVDDVNGKNWLVFEDGRRVNCGSIKVLKVLGGIKGTVLLLIESPGNDESTDIMAYDVQTDEFRTVDYGFGLKKSETNLMRLAEDVTLVTDILIVDEDEKDADGNVTGTYKKLMYSNLYQVNADGTLTNLTDGEYDEYDYDEEDDEYDEDYDATFPIIESMSIVSQADRRDLVVVSTREVVDGKIADRKSPVLYLYRVNRAGIVCEGVGEYEASADAKVYLGGAAGSAPVITVKDANKIQITTSRGTLVVDDPEVVEALKGFNYFDGVYGYEDEDGNTGAKWYYSNKAREEVCFTSVNTDRGTMFEVVA